MQNRNKSDIEINSPKINFNELKNNKDTVVIKNESSYLVLKSFFALIRVIRAKISLSLHKN
jgi:hypothetical protein